MLIRHKQDLYEHLVVAECKYWNSAVERLHVDALVTTVREVGAARGVIFSTEGFQSGAVTQAKAENIDLYVVRDLADDEWGLPGQVVDIFLQILQPGIGNFTFGNVTKIGNPFKKDPVEIKMECGLDGLISLTPTLKRDGSPGGEPLEKYIMDGVKQTFDLSLTKFHLINGGEECIRYIGCPVNLLPDVPFRLPVNGEIIVLPKVSFDMGIKVTQSRITVDRAKNFRFALALVNYVTGNVSSASQHLDMTNTILTPIGPPESVPEGDSPVVNGSVLRVSIKGFFPIEEMSGLNPIPLEPRKPPAEAGTDR